MADSGDARQPQVRHVCFTVNASDEEPLRLLDFEHPSWHHVKFCVYQREFGSHEHFQGYMEFSQPKTYNAIHLLAGMERASLFARRGNAKQASHYCMKPVEGCFCTHCESERSSPTKLEGPWIFGEMSSQGQRADLLAIKREIDNGVSLKRIAQSDEHFVTWVKFPKAFETYQRISTPPRRSKPLVILFVGPSGTGKTRSAALIGRYLGSFYKVPPKHTGFWCDDYSHEDCFLIDEMNGHKMSPEFFNELCDWEPMCVPSHGTAGHQFTSKYVLITSNYHPKFWWKKRSPIQVQQTLRRIDLIIKMIPPKPPVQPCPHCAAGLCAFHHI